MHQNNSYQVRITSCRVQLSGEERHALLCNSVLLPWLHSALTNLETKVTRDYSSVVLKAWVWGFIFFFFAFFQCFATHSFTSYTAVLSAWVSVPRVHSCLPDHMVNAISCRNMTGTERQDLPCISTWQKSLCHVASCANHVNCGSCLGFFFWFWNIG